MTPFEWLAVAYFAAVAVAAARYARPRAWFYTAAAILLVIVARFQAPGPLRAWLPHAYLVLGYWIPAAFTPGINQRFEAWLARADRRLWSSGFGTWNLGFGSWDLGFGIWEFAYLLCYPMVPAAFTVVIVHGDRTDVTRFWLAVLLAGYACYGTLPWTAARPPRLLDAPVSAFREEGPIRAVNAHLLGRVSHSMNTFPSGHVAVALAAALVVSRVSPSWGIGLLAIAAAIAVAAVRGRYHYLVDVLVGAGVGAGSFATATAVS